MTTVDIRELTKTYPAIGGPGITTAVDHVSLTIEPGELFFLLGPSGCGKTTLLRMIAGFIEPTAGALWFTDDAGRRDVTHLAAEKRNTGMVFQSYALWPHMTIAQNVAFGLDVRGIKGAERDRRVREALASVHMEDLAARRPTQLSGGQQQRVALARALVIRPSVLLLDEPLSNLDAKLRLELRAQIRSVCKSAGMTTIYVTHDQKEALSMADRMAVMRAGRVEQAGTPRELYRRPASRFVAEFMGETNVLSGSLDRAPAPTLVTPAGRVQLDPAACPPTATQGSPLAISVRPESIRATTITKQNANNGLAGKVADVCYLGDQLQLSVDLAGTSVRVAVQNPGDDGSTPGVGDAVSLEINPSDVCILSS